MRIPKAKRPHQVLHQTQKSISFLVEGVEVKVSSSDAWVLEHRWFLRGTKTKRVATTVVFPDGSTKNRYMHRLLLDPPGDLEVDHINRDRFDNRRENLRLVDRVTNQQNLGEFTRGKSKHRGVSMDRGRWRGQVACGKKRHKSPRFRHEEEAVEWARRKRAELYGDET